MSTPDQPMVPKRAARYALFMLTIAYVFNFIDRQILDILPLSGRLAA